jgi:TPR repeat protein
MSEAEVAGQPAVKGLPGGATLLAFALRTMPPAALARVLAGDPAKALPLVQAAAAMGLPSGKLRLGRMLLDGAGLPRDAGAAFRWFWSAAQQDDIDAWNMVGRCFENGWGVLQDFAQAAHWFERAADAGDAWAQYNLGHLCLNGLGVRRDAVLAISWYRTASEQGHPRAMNLLGRCCEQGWGTPLDKAAAAYWYQRSAEGGYFRGQYNHATLLHEAGAYGAADRWLQMAAASAPPDSLPPIAAKAIEWAHMNARRADPDGGMHRLSGDQPASAPAAQNGSFPCGGAA